MECVNQNRGGNSDVGNTDLRDKGTSEQFICTSTESVSNQFNLQLNKYLYVFEYIKGDLDNLGKELN